MKSQTIPMSIDDFHVMPWKLGWKYEYWDGAAQISPRHTALATAVVNVEPRPVHAPCLLRPVQEADIPLLLPAYLRAFADTIDYCDYSLEQITDAARRNLHTFFSGKRGDPLPASHVALAPVQEGPTVIGTAHLVMKPRGYPFLDLLFVVPEWHRQGVAMALVATAMNALHADGQSILKSRYMLGNEESRQWHQHFGFVEEMDLYLVRHYYAHALHEWERHEQLGDLPAAELAQLQADRDAWYARVAALETRADANGLASVLPDFD